MSKVLQLRILKPGLMTTIQDHGRWAYRSFGVPANGPMDSVSAKYANQLVGNHATCPVMEFAISGPDIEVSGEGFIALTGATFKAVLDQEILPLNKLIAISGTHHLKITRAHAGCWGYLAVAGNWALKQWLNSASTSPQNGLQLTPDSIIREGTRLEVSSTEMIFPPKLSGRNTLNASVIRILPGPEYHQMSTDTIKELLGATFTISTHRNRMGYRLNANLASYQNPLEIISSGVTPGTIQITPSGQLIVLMADAQTTGGYPRIANVISADLGSLAQINPGNPFRFQLVSLHEACQVQDN